MNSYLKVNSSFGFGLTLITVINDGTLMAIENKPPFVPFGSEAFDGCRSVLVIAAQFVQITTA